MASEVTMPPPKLTPLSPDEQASLETLSLDALIALALSHGMIDAGGRRGEQATIVIGRETITLSSKRARLFLLAVIRACQAMLGGDSTQE
jgi:hypothetical protein